MPSNQKSKEKKSASSTTKKVTVSKKTNSVASEKKNTRNTNRSVSSKKKSTVKAEITKKSLPTKVTSTKTSSNNKGKSSTRNQGVSKNSKKKSTTKKVPKFSTITNIKEDSQVETSKKSKSTVVKNSVANKQNNVDKGKTNKVEKIKNNILNTIGDKFSKKQSKRTIPQSRKKVSSQKTNGKKNSTKTTKKSLVITQKSKKWLICISIICCLIILLEAGYFIYHQIEHERNTVYYDSLNSLIIDDMDIVAVGSSNFKYSKHNDYTKGLEKAKLIKYDSSGEIIFEKMYDKGINTTFSSIISVADGYIVVGSGEFSEEEQQDGGREAMIIKYDKEGNIIWEKYYQVVTNTRFNKVIATADGYVAIGQSIYANMEMGNHTTGGGIIVKYDFDGNEVWHNNHGGMKSGNFNDIVEVNGDFYVVGKDATDSGNLVKFNKDGEYQWHKNYSYTDGIGFTGIVSLDQALNKKRKKKILPEGTGDDDNRDTTNTDALLVKYDLNGEIIFEKNFGGSNYERYNSILAYRDELYVVGHTSSKDAGLKISTDGELMTGILVRYDQEGNILKKEALGGSNNDNLTDITTDSVSLYISGYSNSDDGNITTAKNNGKDYFGKIIKLDFKFRTLMVK